MNAQNCNRKTALIYASLRKKCLDIVKCLVDSGADVNIQDKEGRTALMYG